MGGIQYKAFISYSHMDEPWARWLQHALETYRVPRRLRGRTTDVGVVPDRLRPVFRDRDDLGAAHDLNEEIREALRQSEALIVICSPAAARSRWINEEIRLFREMGRGHRILTLIVDGEPESADPGRACFPEALLAGPEDEPAHEPLASDARKWADGKALAKLKLIAGLLGLPLDELRQREHQRQIRRRAVAGVLLLGLALAAYFNITTWQASEQRRDSGEALVAMKLNELRALMRVQHDPTELRRIEEWPPADREAIWSSAVAGDRSPLDQALALRDEGITFWEAGDLDQAESVLRTSWLINALQFREAPDDQDVYFELGQAEFWLGQIDMDLGNLLDAEDAFIAYAEITRQLIEADPENPELVLEMAYALTNLGSLAIALGDDPQRVRQFMQSALEYNQIALVLDPGNPLYTAELGHSLINLGRAQVEVCDIEGALETTMKSVELERSNLDEAVEDYDHQRNLAAALSSRATIYGYLGQLEDAFEDELAARDMLAGIHEARPDDAEVLSMVLWRNAALAYGHAREDSSTENLDEAMAELAEFARLMNSERAPGQRVSYFYLGTQTRLAELLAREGDRVRALELVRLSLDEAAEILTGSQAQNWVEYVIVSNQRIHWELTGRLAGEPYDSLLPESVPRRDMKSCAAAYMGLNLAIMQGDDGDARYFADYLWQRNYRDPEYLRLCSDYSVCGGR